VPWALSLLGFAQLVVTILPVWQRGFSDHRIRDAADLETHIRYICENPVRKKLVIDPREFHWSSTSGNYELDEPPQGLKPLQKGEAAFRHG
jgi:putative transposase